MFSLLSPYLKGCIISLKVTQSLSIHMFYYFYAKGTGFSRSLKYFFMILSAAVSTIFCMFILSDSVHPELENACQEKVIHLSECSEYRTVVRCLQENVFWLRGQVAPSKLPQRPSDFGSASCVLMVVLFRLKKQI